MADRAKHDKKYYDAHKEDIKKRKKQYNKENKARIAERSAKYHQKHKETINAQDRQEYAEKAKDKPARPCIDCGAPIPKRAQKYCLECREKHRLLNVNQAMQRMRSKQSKNNE